MRGFYHNLCGCYLSAKCVPRQGQDKGKVFVAVLSRFIFELDVVQVFLFGAEQTWVSARLEWIKWRHRSSSATASKRMATGAVLAVTHWLRYSIWESEVLCADSGWSESLGIFFRRVEGTSCGRVSFRCWGDCRGLRCLVGRSSSRYNSSALHCQLGVHLQERINPSRRKTSVKTF